MNSVYDRIYAVCVMRGTTPGAVCDKLGMRRAIISDLKSGKTKSLGSDKIAMIANHLRVSCDYLITGEEFRMDYSFDEQQLLHAWRTCTQAERENVAFILRGYGVTLPENKAEENAG